MFQVVYYFRYRFLRPALSCVIMAQRVLLNGPIKIFDLFRGLQRVSHFLEKVSPIIGQPKHGASDRENGHVVSVRSLLSHRSGAQSVDRYLVAASTGRLFSQHCSMTLRRKRAWRKDGWSSPDLLCRQSYETSNTVHTRMSLESARQLCQRATKVPLTDSFRTGAGKQW